MTRTLQIVLFLFIFALSANVSFGQKPTPTPKATASDDSDDDGIINADDACLFDKGTKANKGCPGEDEKLTSAEAKKQNQPFSNCQFIIEDEGCREFYGNSAEDLRSIFGQFPRNGEYPQLGVQFYLWGPKDITAKELVGEIKFYGPYEQTVKPFAGNPGKKIGWNASRDDIIKNYGEPTGEKNWDTGMKIVELFYGETLKIKLVDGKIYTVTIIYGNYQAESSAYYAKLENEKKEKQEKERLAKIQAEADRKARANKTLEEKLEDYRKKLKERDGIKTTDEEDEKETKKLKEKLDSLESNIDILATPTPKPTPTTAATPKPTPVVVQTTNTAANGSISDCKLILSEGCRNYFFGTNIGAIRTQLGLKEGSYNRTLSMQVYNWSGIELYVEPSSGRVITIRIDEYVKDWKPAKNLKWGEGMNKIKEKYSGGEYSRIYNGESLKFPDYDLQFREGNLHRIEFEQPLTESESAAKAIRERSDDAIELEKYRAENTPKAQAEKMRSDYKETISYLKEYSQKINYYNVNRDAEKVKLYQKLALSEIDSFIKRYAGKMPKDMEDQLSGFRSQLADKVAPN